MITDLHGNNKDVTAQAVATQLLAVTPNERPIVRIAMLSAEAAAYLKRINAAMRRDGSPLATRLRFCGLWCDGYRAWINGEPLPMAAHAAFADGWDTARQEAAYWECMADQPRWTDWQELSKDILAEKEIR